MPVYQAPVEKISFLFNHVLKIQDFQHLKGFDELTPDLLEAVLEGAGKLVEEEFFPLNRHGDEEGCRLENNRVQVPSGFAEAYAKYCEGGWASLTADECDGGQALPHMLGGAVMEMLSSANFALSLFPLLSHSAYMALKAHASDDIRKTYLPKMASGTWTGTMHLTEPHAGTDLALLRTKATPLDDGSYAIEGTKIFITCGEHELAENIIHLVLARLPDAPEGVRGISLFVVPKFMVNEDGSLGARNQVFCASLEKKMGIHGSPTCVMNLDNAKGFLVGAPHQGLKSMFTMMNAARLFVGIQGLSQAEVAYQNAHAYACDRLQGRGPRGPVNEKSSADPIIIHPDVRRMLLTQKSQIEAGRALTLYTLMQMDLAHAAETDQEREEADDLTAFLTPVVKAHLSDIGSEGANLAVQCFGGHGFVREWGVEQFVRDARICQIYEGTNGVQAMDLVGRKMNIHDGRLPRRFFNKVAQSLPKMEDGPAQEFIAPLRKALDRLQAALEDVAAMDMADRGAAAYPAMQAVGTLGLAWMWAEMAHAATNTNMAKIPTARFYFQQILPKLDYLCEIVRSGGQVIERHPIGHVA